MYLIKMDVNDAGSKLLRNFVYQKTPQAPFLNVLNLLKLNSLVDTLNV